MSVARSLVARAPGATLGDRLKVALLRAVRTFIQGVAAAFGTAGVGTTVITTSYWTAFGVAVAGAGITAFASFLQNVSKLFPDPEG
jgi:hypothetical protein